MPRMQGSLRGQILQNNGKSVAQGASAVQAVQVFAENHLLEIRGRADMRKMLRFAETGLRLLRKANRGEMRQNRAEKLSFSLRKFFFRRILFILQNTELERETAENAALLRTSSTLAHGKARFRLKGKRAI